MPKSIAIIGAGVAGLAAGCYAQMNGYQSEIFEMHDLPGGLCTAWERRDYVFDGCIHYLLGTAPGQPYHTLWDELGVADIPAINHDEMMRVVGSDGRTFVLYCDPDQLEAHLVDLAPGDEKPLRAFCRGVRQFLDFDLSAMQAKPRQLMRATDGLALGRQMLPYLQPLVQWGRVSAADFAARLQDPFLRRAFELVFGWPEIPIMAGMSLLAAMQTQNAGFPAGGSLAFARALEARYLALGGTIHYKAQVEQILVENDRAVGVRLYDDSEHRADYVISAADGRGTIFHMLDGKYVERGLGRMYAGEQTLHSQVQVSFGVARDLANEPHWVTYLYDEPFMLAGDARTDLGVKNYCFDPTLAPAGCSSVVVMVRSEYPYWQRIYGRKLYDTEQLQVAEIILAELEKIYPGIGADIKVTDVATPLSYERYTGNWLGSTCGWLLTTKMVKPMILGVRKTLPGLGNFYMAGQWVEPGGMVPVVAMSGRNAIQLICHADGRAFTTTHAA